MSLYQLPGFQGYPSGRLVEIAGPWHRYGRVMSTLKENYVLPGGPFVADGPHKFPVGSPMSLYLIRGIEKEDEKFLVATDAFPVWGITT